MHAVVLSLCLVLITVSSLLASPYVYDLIEVDGRRAFSAAAISNSGHVIGIAPGPSFPSSFSSFPYLRSPDGHIDVLTNIPSDGRALGINSLATIVGTTAHPLPRRSPDLSGFIIENGTLSQFVVPGTPFGPGTTTASGINDIGQIVGAFGVQGYVKTGSNFAFFEVPGARSTGPASINSKGEIAGTFVDGRGEHQGFLLSGGTITPINFPDVRTTEVRGINDAGQIVGVHSRGMFSPAGEGFLRQPDGTFIDIAPPGTLFTDVNGINNSGIIVGAFEDDSGIFKAFIATPVPEPVTALLLGAGFPVLWLWRRYNGSRSNLNP